MNDENGGDENVDYIVLIFSQCGHASWQTFVNV